MVLLLQKQVQSQGHGELHYRRVTVNMLPLSHREHIPEHFQYTRATMNADGEISCGGELPWIHSSLLTPTIQCNKIQYNRCLPCHTIQRYTTQYDTITLSSQKQRGSSSATWICSYRILTLNVLHHTISHKLCSSDMEDMHGLQCFASSSTQSEASESLLFILCLKREMFLLTFGF